MGIEDSVEEKELRDTLEAYDDELKNIKNVVIREGRNGLRTAVIRVPARAGRRMIEEKRIKIGWGLSRIKEFDEREQACNKCREKGHVAKDCSGAEKRKCFVCKEVRHLIAVNKNPRGTSSIEKIMRSTGRELHPSPNSLKRQNDKNITDKCGERPRFARANEASGGRN